MTMHAEQLMGAQVTGSDGHPVGIVNQVFRDDIDGTPSWVRIQSGKQECLVPLNGGFMTTKGLSVPFDSKKIAGEPALEIGKHMSVAQEQELRGYFGLAVPAQAADQWTGTDRAGAEQTGAEQTGADRTQPDAVRPEPGAGVGTPEPGLADQPMHAAGQAPESGSIDQGWLVRTEERMDVGTEVLESGRVRLRKYVETEPVERVVHVFHEDYEVEHVPIRPGEDLAGAASDGEQELILHEERAVLMKESVPVERVRLAARRVDEDKTFRGEIRKERIEVETEATPQPELPAGA